jgi:hypothetical protein
LLNATQLIKTVMPIMRVVILKPDKSIIKFKSRHLGPIIHQLLIFTQKKESIDP